MYADTMPGEIAAWVQAEQAKCAAATEGPWLADWTIDPPDGGDLWFAGVVIDGELEAVVPAGYCPKEDVEFIASARTGYPVLLDYATGLLDAHRVADVMDDACGTESTRDIRDTLRSQIAALHAALVAQGLIGGKG